MLAERVYDVTVFWLLLVSLRPAFVLEFKALLVGLVLRGLCALAWHSLVLGVAWVTGYGPLIPWR